MKIAVLSDIHGNHIALKTVLEEAKAENVRHLFILGDLVGYYYHPDMVVQLLDPWSKDMIRGNHELLLKKAMQEKKESEKIRKKYGSGIHFAMQKMNKQAIKNLTDLPPSKKISIDSLRFKLCHGSPWNPDFYIYPDATDEIFAKCISQDIDFILIGHSHYSFFHQKGNTTIINAGSIGQARDRGGIASWVIIDTLSKTFLLKKTEYDPKEIIKEVKMIDPENSYLSEVLIRFENNQSKNEI